MMTLIQVIPLFKIITQRKAEFVPVTAHSSVTVHIGAHNTILINFNTDTYNPNVSCLKHRGK